MNWRYYAFVYYWIYLVVVALLFTNKDWAVYQTSVYMRLMINEVLTVWFSSPTSGLIAPTATKLRYYINIVLNLQIICLSHHQKVQGLEAGLIWLATLYMPSLFLNQLFCLITPESVIARVITREVSLGISRNKRTHNVSSTNTNDLETGHLIPRRQRFVICRYMKLKVVTWECRDTRFKTLYKFCIRMHNCCHINCHGFD